MGQTTWRRAPHRAILPPRLDFSRYFCRPPWSGSAPMWRTPGVVFTFEFDTNWPTSLDKSAIEPMMARLLLASRPFIPRQGAIAQMSDFKIGDKAVYPAHGVAEVVGVETKEI